MFTNSDCKYYEYRDYEKRCYYVGEKGAIRRKLDDVFGLFEYIPNREKFYYNWDLNIKQESSQIAYPEHLDFYCDLLFYHIDWKNRDFFYLETLLCFFYVICVLYLFYQYWLCYRVEWELTDDYKQLAYKFFVPIFTALLIILTILFTWLHVYWNLILVGCILLFTYEHFLASLRPLSSIMPEHHGPYWFSVCYFSGFVVVVFLMEYYKILSWAVFPCIWSYLFFFCLIPKKKLLNFDSIKLMLKDENILFLNALFISLMISLMFYIKIIWKAFTVPDSVGNSLVVYNSAALSWLTTYLYGYALSYYYIIPRVGMWFCIVTSKSTKYKRNFLVFLSIATIWYMVIDFLGGYYFWFLFRIIIVTFVFFYYYNIVYWFKIKKKVYDDRLVQLGVMDLDELSSLKSNVRFLGLSFLIVFFFWFICCS